MLDRFLKLADIRVVDVKQVVVKTYGKVQGTLQKKGLIGGAFDMLIATTCLVYNLALITGNKKDFTKVKNLKLLDD